MNLRGWGIKKKAEDFSSALLFIVWIFSVKTES